MGDARQAFRQMMAARNFPDGTCPASRHVAMMAEALAKGKGYAMLDEEPDLCAESMAATVKALWDARAEIAHLRAKVDAADRLASAVAIEADKAGMDHAVLDALTAYKEAKG